MLEAALTAGILSTGAKVVSVGVMPTPAVAYLTASGPVQAGVMISASHNPAADNGIKFFSHDGYKLPDDWEDEIQSLVEGEDNAPRPAGDAVGTARFWGDAKDSYLEFLRTAVPLNLRGMRIVLDCANGAASVCAPELFQALGAEVVAINNEPDGLNINADCGSTHPEAMMRTVIEKQAALGLAFDGDADRLIACDEMGRPVNGDHVLYALGSTARKEGTLVNSTLVGTILSNMGLAVALDREGIKLLRAPVGDRYVLQQMKETGAILGGEQSGHLIDLRHATTGDGMLSALLLIDTLVKSGEPMSVWRDRLREFPQVSINVKSDRKNDIINHPDVLKARRQVEADLKGTGRVVLRASGTEPSVRVMIEAEDKIMAERLAGRLAEAIKAAEGM
jgi:phosphoglucosamine mutase